MAEINYKEELNESQYEAVRYIDGPSLVIAGAGSGKTRVLTYKIAYLLEMGYEPYSILALTFTNKAAEEMKNRIAKQVGWERARNLWMGTFHSVFSRILQREGQLLGFSARFTIYDQADSRNLIKTIIKEMGLDEKVYKPATVQCHISNAKNQLMLPADYATDAEIFKTDQQEKIPATRDIYDKYFERCKQSNAMDFDDLLLYTYILFKRYPDVLQRYATRFRYILVDEYQDTNRAQHRIVEQLATVNNRVCAVGDDAQSIYSFRGAKIENILEFTRLYKEAKLFKLEQNYRSTRCIVDAANSLIAKNRNRIPKTVFSKKEQGDPIRVSEAYSDVEEGEIVVNQIQQLRRKEHGAFSDFAILYRTNAQSRIFEEALRKRSIPYRIYGGLSFYQRKEIKDVIAYFRLAVNPSDEEAFKRVVNYPARGIGDTTVNKIIASAFDAGVSLWDVICNPMQYRLDVNKGTLAKLQGFRSMIEGFIALAAQKDAYAVGQEIISTSGIMKEIYQDRTPENLSRQENVEELVNSLQDFCSSRQEEGDTAVALTDFLSEVSLLSEQDMDKGAGDDKVTLMTVHSAKGLEFRTVFIVGMEEGIFPSLMAQSPTEMEEERRLFYVAITRAEEHCFLSYARSRFRYGKMEFGSPSGFLRDIDEDYLQLPQSANSYGESRTRDGQQFRSYRQFDTQRDEPQWTKREEPQWTRRDEPQWTKPKSEPLIPFTSPRKLTRVSASSASASRPSAGAAVSVREGQHIRHERFGVGEVTRVEGTGENCKATVVFQNAGTKQLLLKFARFEVID